MEYCKLQIGCMLIILYVGFIYIRERYAYKVKSREIIFELLLIVGIINVAFDGITAYTVNHLGQVPGVVNAILHACFLCSLDAMVFIIFLYILNITLGIPHSRRYRMYLTLPFAINIAVVILFIPLLEYRSGDITNYSMGISAYTCFIMVAVYMIASVVLLVIEHKNMGYHKLITIATCIAVSIAVTVFQMLNPQALISCLVTTMVIIGAYLNMENPLFLQLQAHNQQMVMGFATLVENRDGSTGEHIRRTTTYVRMLAEELRRREFYREQLTEDYIKNLVLAAPMHDVGKIAIPDAILQKPGKLTDDEYEIMKTHSEKGGDIIRESFSNIGDSEYEKIAYEVARFHHEKWNGKGYPEGLSQNDIPLCARIMAVADVFDAVSSKRCYRDALPIDDCFKIIEDGSGKDFDPIVAEIFLVMKEKITQVVKENQDGKA